MAIQWLHLSDIHFHQKDAWRDQRARRDLLEFLRKRFEGGKLPRPDLIFCTGDIAFGETSGHPLAEQYGQAQEFFTELLALCALPRERLFVVPGNHDINRSAVDEDAQAALESMARDSREHVKRINSRLETRPNTFTNAMKRLQAYADFIAAFLPHQQDKEGRCIYQSLLKIGDVQVGIAGFNSAWSCAGVEDERRLWLGAEWQFNRAATHLQKADLRIGLIHHPLDWLCEAEREHAQQRIAAEFDFWLFGHMHNAWIEPMASHVRIGAGAIGAETADGFGLNLVQLEADKGRAHLFQYRQGWTIHPLPRHADDGVWEFALPVRVRMGANQASANAAREASLPALTAEILPTITTFQLQSLELRNYRHVRHSRLHLHEHLTVLIAPNGGGKSGIINAIRLMLQAFVCRFDLADSREPTLSLDDIHVRSSSQGGLLRDLPCMLEVRALLAGKEQIWTLQRNDERPYEAIPPKMETLPGNELQRSADRLQAHLRQNPHAAVTVPVIVCYGTTRLSGQQVLAAHESHQSEQFHRLYGYRGALDAATDFSRFSEWFTWLCQWRDQELASLGAQSPTLYAKTRWGAMLHAVRAAIDTIIRPTTGWHSLDYSVEHERALILRHEEFGILKVAQLSDGIRGMLALAGDLAWRCIKLNPHLGKEAALKAPGVVLIDELDMHLHPSWQQHVVQQLRAAFPKLQFIVTTHSPQILSCVPKECIRMICPPSAEGEVIVDQPDWQTEGTSPAAILAHVMGVNPIPDVEPVQQLNQYRALIESGQHEKAAAQKLRTILLNHFGAGHEVMLECERLIRLAQFKQRTAARHAGEGHA